MKHTCPHCQREYVVRASGLLSRHRLPNKAQQDNGSYWCPGSDLKVGDTAHGGPDYPRQDGGLSGWEQQRQDFMTDGR